MDPAIPIDHDVVEQLARAVLGQLAPLTGTRATGAVTVENDTDDDVEIGKNSYLLPVVGSHEGPGKGELRDDLVFKTAANPATLGAHGKGGGWVVPAHDSLAVGIVSNVGGAQHNLPEGTVFQWDPPLDFLGARCELAADMTDGAPPPDGSRVPVLRVAYYEDLNSAAIERDIQSARLQLPGLVLCWEQSTPAEGRTAGINQGGTRNSDGRRMFMEWFRLFVVVGHHSTDARRRGTGLRILQACTRLLTDQQITRDFERLVSQGSLEILSRNRFSRDERHYVYTLGFRVQRVYSVLDARSFVPWLQTHLMAALPGREAPEPTDPLTIVDVTDPNPPGPP